MTELEQYINSYFGVDDSGAIKIILSHFKPVKIKKGDYLVHQGKQCNELSFVQQGIIRMFLHKEDKEITQWISTKGQFATDLTSFVFNTPSLINIQALSDTEIYSISKNDYANLGSTLPQWHKLEKMFLLNCFITLEQRVLSHLAMTAEERYVSFFEKNKELFNQVPLQYIASMLGMTPETLSRLRKKKSM